MLKSMNNRPPLHVSINNYVTRPSFKNLSDNFFMQVARQCQGCQKVFYIFKVTSRGRAEIQNGHSLFLICHWWSLFGLFRFDKMSQLEQSFIFLKYPFSLFKFQHAFDIFGHLVKQLTLRFVKDALATKLLRETYKEIWYSVILDVFSRDLY